MSSTTANGKDVSTESDESGYCVVCDEYGDRTMSTGTDGYEIERPFAHPVGVEITVPVEVELPPAVLELCRSQYALDRQCGKNADLADYLADVVKFDLSYHVDGEPIDMNTGRIQEADE